MMNFDAPDLYYCVVRRQKTATPLQSLVLMNDPQFIEAARMCGERMLKESGNNMEQRIDFAYKLLIGRSPRKEELDRTINLYKAELLEFKDNPDRVRDWLSVGEVAVDPALDPALLAASATIASALMNFEEFVMKR